MRTTIAVVLGAISLTSAFVFLQINQTLPNRQTMGQHPVFGHDDRVPVNDDPITVGCGWGNWKRPAAIYVQRR